MGKYDNTIPGGVRSWLLSENLGDGREILRVGKTVSAHTSLRFGLVTNQIVNIGKLSTENLGNEGAERLRTKIWRYRPWKATSREYRDFLSHYFLLRSFLAEFRDWVGTVGWEVTLNIRISAMLMRGGG